jgi:type IV pilus assembly protein PilW
VAAFDDDGNASTQRVPYLMLSRGLDLDDDGDVDLEDASPVAGSIEQLQVAYILNTSSSAAPPLLGVDDLGAAWGDAWAASVTGPELDDPYVRPANQAGQDPRLTLHPANIRQVRLTVVGRSTQSEAGFAGEDLSQPLAGADLASGQTPWQRLENLSFPVGGGADSARPFSPVGGGYRRVVLRLSVAPKNLLMRSQFAAFLPGGG